MKIAGKTILIFSFWAFCACQAFAQQPPDAAQSNNQTSQDTSVQKDSTDKKAKKVEIIRGKSKES